MKLCSTCPFANKQIDWRMKEDEIGHTAVAHFVDMDKKF